MKELCPDTVEDLPSNAPKSKGRSVQISCSVDADNGRDQITRISRTVIFIFLNKYPIMWYSKRQNTVETYTFGSEFVAMKKAVEMIKAPKFNLQIFGIEIMDNATKNFGENNAVMLNYLVP